MSNVRLAEVPKNNNNPVNRMYLVWFVSIKRRTK